MNLDLNNQNMTAENLSNRWTSPVLITGCPRTGTSALARLLTTHKNICIFNEYSLYFAPEFEESTWHRLREMREDNPPPVRICNSMANLQEMLAEKFPDPVPNETIRDWLFNLMPYPVHIYGDKMPYRYMLNMEKIVSKNPGVKFLITLRDGRAVVASQLRNHKMSLENGMKPDRWMVDTVQEAEKLWLRSAKKWIEYRDNPPAPCLEVRYEEASENPQKLAQAICEFTGMQYNAEDFKEFESTYKPVHTELWKEELPEIESELSDEFHQALAALGYS